MSISDVMSLCHSLRRASSVLDLSSADDDSLNEVLAAARSAEAAVGLLVAAVAERAGQLAESGAAAPPREFLLGDGSAVTGRQAGVESARARVLAAFPDLRPLLTTGSVGVHHLDAVARHVLPLCDQQRSLIDERGLIDAADRLPADTFNTFTRRAARAAEVGAERAAESTAEGPKAAERRVAASSLRHWFDAETGMGHVHARLDPERYEALTGALDRQTTALASTADQPTTKNANLAAAALVHLVTHGAAPEPCGAGTPGRAVPHLTVVIGPQGAQTGNGHEIPPDAVQRLLCDAVVQHVHLDNDGLPTHVGRRRRTATAAQWTALRSIYSSCAWHGCQRPLSWCELHHIHEWQRGGRTDLDNLVPLCSEHHHRVHEGRWTIQLGHDRSLRIYRPDGTHHTTTDPPTRWPTLLTNGTSRC